MIRMRPTSRVLLTAVLLALPAAARAQFAQQPSPSIYAPNPNMQAIARPSILDQPVTPQIAPTYGWGTAPVYGLGWGAPYGWGGWGPGSYLNGVANVTTANAQALVTIQGARQAQAQADAAQLDYRRRLFDQLRYERMNSPTAEDIREYERQQALRRARNDPPATEIWSASALNALLQSIQKTHSVTGASGPSVPLDPTLVRHINVTTGVTRAGAGIFGDRLRWPLPLAVERFSAERERIEKLVKEAVAQIERTGNPDAGTLVDLNTAIRDLQTKADAEVGRMSPSDSIRADRFLRELREGVRVLEQPNVVNFFNGKWSAQGDTVGDLIFHLTRNGLRFAPATQGDEAFYTALYHAMLTYDAGLMRLVSR
jgi:hypothetical protein